MKRLLTLTLMFLLWLPASAVTRRALVVFVGEYPEDSGWKKISAERDCRIVLDMLHAGDFRDSDIAVLGDSDATHDAIIRAFSTLVSKAQKGDVVYVHFSCHGQQVTDLDGDEPDGWDEALIPYDARISYGDHGYMGGKHLIDDEVNRFLAALSSKVGETGLVLYVSDACHSGDDYRANEETADDVTMRGILDRFEISGSHADFSERLNADGWVSICACREYQNNYEVTVDGQRCGRLTYAMSRVFSKGLSMESLVKAIEKEYLLLPTPKGCPRQLVSYNIPQGMEARKIR